jgi:hypothetical protein
MPTIENYSEHPYQFPRGAIATKALNIPRGGAVKGKESEGFKPSVTEVSDEDLKAMREHPVARSWFNRENLIVKDAPKAAAKQ